MEAFFFLKKNLQIELLYNLRILLLVTYPMELELLLNRYLHIYAHFSISHNRQGLETI